MSRLLRIGGVVVLLGVLAVAALRLTVLPTVGSTAFAVDVTDLHGDPARGEYVLRVAGCVGCHTDTENDGAFLAGGPPLVTPFGTFHAPNITPDPEHGIGGWSVEQLSVALTAGLAPDGTHYFPAFPYTSYVRLRAADIADLKAYLDTVAPIAEPSLPHRLRWPFSERRLLAPWKALAFESTPFVPDEERGEAWNRGAYLVDGPGHCGECHTDRNLVGALTGDGLHGTPNGPDGEPVPAIVGQDAELSDWSADDVALYLQTGFRPDGDVSGGVMVDVIDTSTSFLSDPDAAAIAEYLKHPR